jgi:hypothetical protein
LKIRKGKGKERNVGQLRRRLRPEKGNQKEKRRKGKERK